MEERGLRAGGEGRGDKRALCDSEDLAKFLGPQESTMGFGHNQKAELGLEPRRSLDSQL